MVSGKVSEHGIWDKVDQIPDDELWRVRERRRDRLVSFSRERLKSQYEQRGMSDYEVRKAREVLSSDALTIGFARRFAPHTSALLCCYQIRIGLTRACLQTRRDPFQILFAGKAHPRDDGGKELIRQIVQFSRREEVRSHIVFLEDYDLAVARYLVQGVDVWLNTPRRPMEASGTSGMKVLANGGMNVSIPDGWWAEGYRSNTGWSIGRGEEYSDPNYQDRIEAMALYDILEKEVVPLFYDRSSEGLPRAWITRIKSSMRILCPTFNTEFGMVSEYAERFYFPSSIRATKLSADTLKGASELVVWKHRLREKWNQVKVQSVTTSGPETLTSAEADANTQETLSVGNVLYVAADIRLGELAPEDVVVQAYRGPLDSNHQVTFGAGIPLALVESRDGVFRYEGEIICDTTGRQGFSVRVLPYHPDAELPHELNLITWE